MSTINISNLLYPTENLINDYICIFDDPEDNGRFDKLIYDLINKIPYNKEYNDILTKVILINRLYNTNIFNIYLMTAIIKDLMIDDYLNKCDTDIVKLIDSKYYKIDKFGNVKYISCYSFATKYCNFHNSNYPIYDNIIANMLYLYNKKDRFSIFKKDDLRNYDIFIRVLNDFTSFYKLYNINFKNLDKFLWQYGKEFLTNY